MANVKIIPPREKKPAILRVAAYCRVSTDSSDQLHSYAAQIRAYTEEISKHANWKLVDVYADEGLTGTRTDKREDFNRMLSDCRKGKIDKVLVKSISRFARNTKDCLEALRELTSLGVSVFFEEEDIHSETLTTELMVSVFGALAQQESVSISQNLRISYQKRMERGEFITCKAPLGYRLSDRKNLEIIPEEAELVRWIFQAYLNGHSTEWIAAYLNAQKIPTAWRRGKWHTKVVKEILKNEKYIGDSLCRKTYATDSFPFTRQDNSGTVEQYYIENTHTAIIDREAFEKVQSLMKRRAERKPVIQQTYPLSKKIVCEECGSIFSRCKGKSGRITWACRTHNTDASACPMGRIPEKEIYAAFVRMYNKFKRYDEVILKPALIQIDVLNNQLQQGLPGVAAVNLAIAEASEQSHKVTLLQSRGLLDAAACTVKLREIETRLTELRRKRRNLLKNDATEEIREALEQTAGIIEEGPDLLDSSDETLFAGLVEKITAKSQTCICFHLYGGITLSERLQEVRR